MLYCELFNVSHTFAMVPAQALSVSCCDNFCFYGECVSVLWYIHDINT